MENDEKKPEGENEIEKVELTSDERMMGMLCHLLGIFTWFLGPLIIWLVKKDESKFVDHHGKEALNFGITVMIAWAVSVVLTAATCGMLFFVPIGVGIVALIYFVIGTVNANDGEWYKYPISIRFVK